jgi:hypothetical protein
LAAKIKGRFCERRLAKLRTFDRRSFRWARRGRNWILVGCPKGQWNAKRARCKVGTKAKSILVAAKSDKPCCPKRRTGERCVVKGR